jgi:protoporphyrinogen/coproporphyrinogen III oxidase
VGEVIIIGGGIAGLSCAEEILRRDPGTSLLLLEAENRLGGNIRTSREEGFTLEWGVNGFLDGVVETLDLVDRIGLGDELLPARDAAGRRFIFRGGRLREIPLHPLRFFASDLLTLRGRLRILGEPFARAAREEDQSVFQFASRRIGREAAEILVDAMVSGVYAGDARRLSLEATFPKMAAMEREHGSLVRALIARRRETRRRGGARGGPSGPAGTLTSFRSGMEILIDTLRERVGSQRIRLHAPVGAVERRGTAFRVTVGAAGETLEAERVIVASPARVAEAFLRPLDSHLADRLAEVTYAGLAVVAVAYRTDELRRKPEGFGFLAPRGQGLRILGCLWDSSVFENRAPEGWTLLRAMVGGAHDPGAVDLSDETLVATARRDLETSMGIDVAPRLIRVFRHPLGIPQYSIGHPALLRGIDACLVRHPGLFLVGNSYRGIAVNNCVKEAAELGQRWGNTSG